MIRLTLAALVGLLGTAVISPSTVDAQTEPILSAEPTQAAYAWDEPPTVQITLRSASGVPLAGQVVFGTVGDDRRQRRTDADGRAMISFSRHLPHGEHVALIGYPGTREFLGSQISVALIVRQPMITIQTVPPIEGMAFAYLDQQFVTGVDGTATVPVSAVGDQLPTLDDLDIVPHDVELAPGVRASFGRWYGRPRTGLRATVQFHYRVSLTMSDLDGRTLDPDVVSNLTIKSSVGERFNITDIGRPIWFQGSRVVPLGGGLESTELYYTIESATVAGNNVVNRAQHRFLPSETQSWQIRLLLYRATFEVRDALFKFPIGTSVELEQPNGEIISLPIDHEGRAETAKLPRGNYTVTVRGPGLALSRPLALSKNQDVHVEFVSLVDLGVGMAAFLTFTFGLLFAGRPHLLPRIRLRSRLSLPELRRPVVVAIPVARTERPVWSPVQMDVPEAPVQPAPRLLTGIERARLAEARTLEVARTGEPPESAWAQDHSQEALGDTVSGSDRMA